MPKHTPAIGTLLRNRFTRLGLQFAFVGGFAMLGGAIRGLNLLLVLAGLIVAVLMMQWRWCKRSTEALSIDRRLPGQAFAGSPFRVRFRLINHNRILPVWMLRITDTLHGSGVTATAQTGVGVIAGRQIATPGYRCVIHRRGRYEFGSIEVSTLFPFALMRSQMLVSDDQTLDVYPRLLKLRHGWQSRLTRRSGGATVAANRSGVDEGEFFGLRDYRRGDHPKWIHWRTTARTGDLAVCQYEQRHRFDVCVLLDPFAAGGEEIDEPAELAISLAATLLLSLAESPGNQIVLAAAGRGPQAVVGGASYEGRRRLLQTLARVVVTDDPPLHQAIQAAVATVGATQDLIIVSSRSQVDACDRCADLKSLLRQWGRRGSVRWLDVTSGDLDNLVVGYKDLSLKGV